MDQLREIDEAVRAADDALAYLRRAARSLGSARNYGVWDILGGGFLATMLKHSKLDKARELGVHIIDEAQFLHMIEYQKRPETHGS